MNKKIYFNNKFLAFVDGAPQASQNQSIRFHEELSEQKIKNILDDLLSESTVNKSENAQEHYTAAGNFEQVFDYIKKNLYYIEAAGGFIKKENNYLFIYRLGKWDLPKGKLDKGETPEQAAVRECEEECAIDGLKIEKKLPSTFHLYKYKNSYALKQTYWFYMSTNYNKQLKPQTEENIEEVRWFTKEEIESEVFANTYFTIKDVVTGAFTSGLI